MDSVKFDTKRLLTLSNLQSKLAEAEGIIAELKRNGEIIYSVDEHDNINSEFQDVVFSLKDCLDYAISLHKYLHRTAGIKEFNKKFKV